MIRPVWTRTVWNDDAPRTDPFGEAYMLLNPSADVGSDQWWRDARQWIDRYYNHSGGGTPTETA